MKYFDKNEREIKRGMRLKHPDGSYELVYECVDGEGNFDLGFNASNESWLDHTGRNREIYPLHQFNIKEWEIAE